MKYLVDVNVLSEATKPDPDPKVICWLRANESELVIDPVVLGEIRLGILLMPKGKRRAGLQEWFDSRVLRLVCLPWEATTALRWADLLSKLRSRGLTIPLKDSMIAATALVHGLTVVTRNVGDFKRSGVPVLNPFR